jgi:hypothetical protein
MNPQVEIKINQSFQALKVQDQSTVVKEEVKAFLERLQKPFCENDFESAFKKVPFSRITLAGIDFKIKLV